MKLFFLNFFREAKNIFRDFYFKDNLIRITLAAPLILNIALWFFIKNQIKPSPYPIVLHYTIYANSDFLGNANQALTIAFVGSLILAVNIVLGFKIYNYNKLAAYFLNITSILAQIFLFIAVYGLVLFNKL